MTDFSNLVAVVTGAGSGIGRASAQKLALAGAEQVFLCDRDEAAVAAAAANIPRASAVDMDVSDSRSVDDAFARVLAAAGRLDVVVHSAGVDDPEVKTRMYEAATTRTPVEVTRELSDASWRRMLAINLDGAFYVLRASVQAMVPRRAGAVVMIGSLAGFDTMAGYPHYSAAKAGLHALAQSVAKEVAPFGVRVNVVAPGPVDTAMARRTSADLREAVVGANAGRYATADEIADSVLYLASSAATNVTGAVLISNGGRSTF